MTALAQLLPILNETMWHGFAIFLRVAAITSMLPAFGEQSVPTRIKLVLAIAFTLIVAPVISVTSMPAVFGDLVLFILSEVLAGLALGIGIRLFILALQTAGTIAAHATSLSQVFGVAGFDPKPAKGYV